MSLCFVSFYSIRTFIRIIKNMTYNVYQIYLHLRKLCKNKIVYVDLVDWVFYSLLITKPLEYMYINTALSKHPVTNRNHYKTL